MLSRYLGTARVVIALLLPGAGFLLVELIVEPAALTAALPGLLILAAFYGAAVCTVVILRRRGVRPPGFRALLGWAALLVAVDQMLKALVLNRLSLGEEHTLIPAALALTRAHNLRGSWVAVQFHLDFIDDAMLIGASALSALLTLSLYRYYLKQRQQPSLWAGLALVGFVAGLSSAFVDLAIRGFTVDYLGVVGLVVADLKDLYLDVALAAFFAELAENFGAMRRMSNRQMVVHLKRALELTRQEIKALLLRRGSRSTL